MNEINRVEEVVYECPIKTCDWSATQSYQRIDVSYADIEETLLEHLRTHPLSLLPIKMQNILAGKYK